LALADFFPFPRQDIAKKEKKYEDAAQIKLNPKWRLQDEPKQTCHRCSQNSNKTGNVQGGSNMTGTDCV
jgi:hypothetical protein